MATLDICWSSIKDNEKVYGVFTKKGNMHDKLLIIVRTEEDAINYIKEKRNDDNYDKLLFYRELEGKEDVRYWLFEYDKK